MFHLGFKWKGRGWAEVQGRAAVRSSQRGDAAGRVAGELGILEGGQVMSDRRLPPALPVDPSRPCCRPWRTGREEAPPSEVQRCLSPDNRGDLTEGTVLSSPSLRPAGHPTAWPPSVSRGRPLAPPPALLPLCRVLSPAPLPWEPSFRL